MEGYVTSIDPTQYVCNVKSVNGQILSNVVWLTQGPMHTTPALKDKVLVFTGLTYPVIMGILPTVGVQAVDTNSESLLSNPDSSSPMASGSVFNTKKPSDFKSGDFVLKGGDTSSSFFGFLKDGTISLGASSAVRLIMSPLDDSMRFIARVFDYIYDFGQIVMGNAKGRMYSYLGTNRDLNSGILSIYEYEEIQGDVAAGEHCKTNYYDVSDTLPLKDSRVRKIQLSNASSYPLMVETLNDDGSLTLKINQSIAGPTSLETKQDGSLNYKVTGSGNTAQITINPTSITIDYNGGVTGTFSDSNIVFNYKGDAVATLNSSGADIEAKGHFMKINTSGVQLG